MCPGQPHDPAFMVRTREGKVCPLTYKRFSQQIKDWVERVGLPAHKYTSACLWRGGTSWAFKVNLPAEAIKLLGDWASDCFRRYIDVTLEACLKAMHIFTKFM